MNHQSFSKLIETFIEMLVSEKGYSVNTCRAYQQNLTEFLLYTAEKGLIGKKENKNIKSISPLDIDALAIRDYLGYLFKKKNKKSSISRKLSALRSFFRYLVKLGIITDSPAAMIHLPKLDKPIPVFVPVDEVFGLLNSVNTNTLLGLRNLAILETLYSTGLRVSELSGLNVSDVDKGARLVRVRGKGNKERIVPAGNKALKAIDIYRKCVDEVSKDHANERSCKGTETNTPLFLNKNGGRLSSRSIARMVDKVSKECGLNVPVSPHVFRHTFATHLLDAGADLRVVQELLGHESLSTTQKYTHVTLDKLMETYDRSHPRR